MAPLLPTLRELIPSDSAGLFWVNSCGEISNLYGERLLPPDVISRFIESADGWRESAFRGAFLACAETRDGVVAASAGDGLGHAACDHDVLKLLSAQHALYGMVREQSAALGQLCLYRSADALAFGDRERADLASVMRYVAYGVTATEVRFMGDEFAFAFEDSEEEAMLVTDASGTIQFASEEGRRLLLLATVSEINPSSIRSAVNEHARRAIRVLSVRLEAVARGLEATPPVLTLDSKWGRLVLRAYRLSDDRRPGARIGLRIQRQMPMILRFVKAMGRQALSPQQREIALQIALGRSNLEISERLGVTANTVAYHVKQLFQRLGVHNRTEAIEKIASQESANQVKLARKLVHKDDEISKGDMSTSSGNHAAEEERERLRFWDQIVGPHTRDRDPYLKQFVPKC